MAKKTSIRTTTIRLPQPIYEAAKATLRQGTEAEGSLNELFVSAIQSYLKMRERVRIDAEFSGMATDAAYQQDSVQTSRDFETSDWEALKLEEKAPSGEKVNVRNRTR